MYGIFLSRWLSVPLYFNHHLFKTSIFVWKSNQLVSIPLSNSLSTSCIVILKHFWWFLMIHYIWWYLVTFDDFWVFFMRKAQYIMKLVLGQTWPPYTKANLIMPPPSFYFFFLSPRTLLNEIAPRENLIMHLVYPSFGNKQFYERDCVLQSCVDVV